MLDLLPDNYSSEVGLIMLALAGIGGYFIKKTFEKIIENMESVNKKLAEITTQIAVNEANDQNIKDRLEKLENGT